MARILIIDDDQDILRMMEFALRRAGHEPLITTTGSEGLEIVKRNPPQLIIVDIMMPEMTGYDFTRQIRQQPAYADLPILIYSARFQPVDRQTALDAGATDYMPKNVSPPEILQKINELLGEGNKQQTTKWGQAIACFSLRGGVGVTSLTVNLAVILAIAQKTQVCLADLNPIAGHAGLLLGLRPQRQLFDVLAMPGNTLSGVMVQQHLTSHKSGVQLLASPLAPANQPLNHTLRSLIQVLQSEFRFSLIDLPHILDPAQLELLSNLSKVILVLAPDIPSLQSAVAAMKYLVQHGLPPEKIVPVLNQNMLQSGLPAAAIEKTIRRPLAANIPFEKDMAAATKAGRPLILHKPKSAATTALAKLATTLIQ